MKGKKETERDKIPITSVEALREELKAFKAALSIKETEHTWEALDRAVKRFTAVTRGGACRYEQEYIAGLRDRELVKAINGCLSTERTQLSASALLFLSATTRLGSLFSPLLPLYLPTILRLLSRTNKLYVSRSLACLLAIIRNTRLATVIPHLREGMDEKAPTHRRGCIHGLLCALGGDEATYAGMLVDKDLVERKFLDDVEKMMRIGATDRDIEARKMAKRCWEIYRAEYPSRTENFAAPLTPITRRNLDLPPPGQPIPVSSASLQSAHSRPLSASQPALAFAQQRSEADHLKKSSGPIKRMNVARPETAAHQPSQGAAPMRALSPVKSRPPSRSALPSSTSSSTSASASAMAGPSTLPKSHSATTVFAQPQQASASWQASRHVPPLSRSVSASVAPLAAFTSGRVYDTAPHRPPLAKSVTESVTSSSSYFSHHNRQASGPAGLHDQPFQSQHAAGESTQPPPTMHSFHPFKPSFSASVAAFTGSFSAAAALSSRMTAAAAASSSSPATSPTTTEFQLLHHQLEHHQQQERFAASTLQKSAPGPRRAGAGAVHRANGPTHQPVGKASRVFLPQSSVQADTGVEDSHDGTSPPASAAVASGPGSAFVPVKRPASALSVSSVASAASAASGPRSASGSSHGSREGESRPASRNGEAASASASAPGPSTFRPDSAQSTENLISSSISHPADQGGNDLAVSGQNTGMTGASGAAAAQYARPAESGVSAQPPVLQRKPQANNQRAAFKPHRPALAPSASGTSGSSAPRRVPSSLSLAGRNDVAKSIARAEGSNEAGRSEQAPPTNTDSNTSASSGPAHKTKGSSLKDSIAHARSVTTLPAARDSTAKKGTNSTSAIPPAAKRQALSSSLSSRPQPSSSTLPTAARSVSASAASSSTAPGHSKPVARAAPQSSSGAREGSIFSRLAAPTASSSARAKATSKENAANLRSREEKAVKKPVSVPRSGSDQSLGLKSSMSRRMPVEGLHAEAHAQTIKEGQMNVEMETPIVDMLDHLKNHLEEVDPSPSRTVEDAGRDEVKETAQTTLAHHLATSDSKDQSPLDVGGSPQAENAAFHEAAGLPLPSSPEPVEDPVTSPREADDSVRHLHLRESPPGPQIPQARRSTAQEVEAAPELTPASTRESPLTTSGSGKAVVLSLGGLEADIPAEHPAVRIHDDLDISDPPLADPSGQQSAQHGLVQEETDPTKREQAQLSLDEPEALPHDLAEPSAMFHRSTSPLLSSAETAKPEWPAADVGSADPASRSMQKLEAEEDDDIEDEGNATLILPADLTRPALQPECGSTPSEVTRIHMTASPYTASELTEQAQSQAQDVLDQSEALNAAFFSSHDAEESAIALMAEEHPSQKEWWNDSLADRTAVGEDGDGDDEHTLHIPALSAAGAGTQHAPALGYMHEPEEEDENAPPASDGGAGAEAEAEAESEAQEEDEDDIALQISRELSDDSLEELASRYEEDMSRILSLGDFEEGNGTPIQPHGHALRRDAEEGEEEDTAEILSMSVKAHRTLPRERLGGAAESKTPTRPRVALQETEVNRL